jgi:hypothetical protein
MRKNIPKTQPKNKRPKILTCNAPQPAEYIAFRILMYPEVGNHSGSSSHARGEMSMTNPLKRNKPKNRHRRTVTAAAIAACLAGIPGPF